jgi:hypothetical protein
LVVARAVLLVTSVRPFVRSLVLAAAALIALGTVAQAGPDRARVAQAAGAATRATDAALAAVRAGEARRVARMAERARLAERYQRELAAIDRLKRQKASWRRDRQLRAQLSASLETARQLDQVTGAVGGLDLQLARQRRALLAAIDAELAAGPAAARARSVRGLRAEVAARAAPARPRTIVLPDDELDPLADAEELEQHAQALRDSERQLARQLADLDRQATRFRRQADLRKQHQRAGELASRDDDRPRRVAGAVGPGRGVAADEGGPAPQSDDGSGGAPEIDPSFGADVAVVLADVVDAGTADALRRAERSTDPAAKAAAAERARAQVARRLRALEQRRQAIEKRARELRR